MGWSGGGKYFPPSQGTWVRAPYKSMREPIPENCPLTSNSLLAHEWTQACTQSSLHTNFIFLKSDLWAEMSEWMVLQGSEDDLRQRELQGLMTGEIEKFWSGGYTWIAVSQRGKKKQDHKWSTRKNKRLRDHVCLDYELMKVFSLELHSPFSPLNTYWRPDIHSPFSPLNTFWRPDILGMRKL